MISRGAHVAHRVGSADRPWLDDESVVEVMLNPDGKLWLDRLKSGLEDATAYFSPEDGDRIVRLDVHHVGAELHAGLWRSGPSAKTPWSRFTASAIRAMPRLDRPGGAL
ncbi:MAG: hypothetical protein WAK01_12120 [Methylocystis sp.]